jgi:hypothetical protein
MQSTSSTSKGPIQLHYTGGQVVVTPEDQDRFVLGVSQAITACQNEVAGRRFLEQFKNQLLHELCKWCVKHGDRVQSCYLPFPIGGECIKVFVVTKSPIFDFVLSDAIAQLEIDLDGQNWPCDILQIAAETPEEFLAFFDPQYSLQVYGDGDGCTAPDKS